MGGVAGEVRVYLGTDLSAYAFGAEHPFGPKRLPAFERAFHRRALEQRVAIGAPASAREDELPWFHTREYIARVRRQSAKGSGFLDGGDTPAFPGVYEAAATVVGTTLAALGAIVAGECRSAFVPIAGLHHARRDSAAGFCVFNDCGVAIEALRRIHRIRRVAYVDIDAHHGDGVYYGFAADPGVIIADFHEDGRYLYPGTGSVLETGEGAAAGTKLNVPMPPGADDGMFFDRWDGAERFLRSSGAELIILQCGADSLAGDPITHLRYSEAVHAHVASRLGALAGECCEGRLLALGGGGYNLENIGRAWCAVVESLVDASNGQQKDSGGG